MQSAETSLWQIRLLFPFQTWNKQTSKYFVVKIINKLALSRYAFLIARKNFFKIQTKISIEVKVLSVIRATYSCTTCLIQFVVEVKIRCCEKHLYHMVLNQTRSNNVQLKNLWLTKIKCRDVQLEANYLFYIASETNLFKGLMIIKV